MSHLTCETVRPLLPDRGSGTLPPNQSVAVEAHLATCHQCAAEAEVLQALRRGRPEPPEELAVRIQDTLRHAPGSSGAAPRPPTGDSRGGGGPAPWWAPLQRPGLAAAAVVVLALGTAVIWPQVRGGPSLTDLDLDLETPLMVEVWTEDAGIVAGAPVLEELSDEQLLILLEELGG